MATSSTAPVSDTNQLKSMRNGLMKSYIEYDGSSRMETVYEAPAHTGDGEPCLKTTYEYEAAPSTNIVKMLEEVAEWDATWDI